MKLPKNDCVKMISNGSLAFYVQQLKTIFVLYIFYALQDN